MIDPLDLPKHHTWRCPGNLDPRHEVYTYDATDSVASVKDIDTTTGPTGTGVLAGFSYARNQDSQVTHDQATTKLDPTVTSPGLDYGYTNLNQLKTLTTTAPGISGAPSLSAGDVTGPLPYTYDKNGSVTQFPDGAKLSYDHADQLTGIGLGTSELQIGYNKQGDRTSEGEAGQTVATYGYDAADQLTHMGVPGSLDATFDYNGDGLRTDEAITANDTSGTGTKVTTVQQFSYDLAEGMPLTLSDSNDNYIYGPGGLPLEQIDLKNDSVDYFGHDQQGSTRILMSDQRPVATGRYDYTPYGTTLDHYGASTALQYDGQYHDPTGLYYLRARYYDPTTAQFLARDPIDVLTGAAYSYADDDPLNQSDPTGLWPCWANPACDAKVIAHGLADAGKWVGHVVAAGWDDLSGATVGLVHEIQKHATAIEEVLGAATGVVCIVVTAGGCGAVLAWATLAQVVTEGIAAKSFKGFAEQAATTVALSLVGGKIGLEFQEAQKAGNAARAAKLLGRLFTGISTTLGGVLTGTISACG